MSKTNLERLLDWLQRARIDIKNQGEGNDVKIKLLEGEKCDIVSTPRLSGAGYSLVSKDKHLLLEVTCEGAGELIIRLQGIFRKVPNGERLPLWVDYTRMAVNGDVVFWELKPLWHDKTYVFRKPAADGEKVKVEISWSDHAYRGEELARLLSLWSTLPESD